MEKFKILVLILSFPIAINAQNRDCLFDPATDTLPVIGSQVLCSEKVVMHRDSLILGDSIKINKKGFELESFEMSSFALGNSFNLSSGSHKLTTGMRKCLKTNAGENKVIYKFVYLRNMIIRTPDGRKVSPSIKEIRISFID